MTLQLQSFQDFLAVFTLVVYFIDQLKGFFIVAVLNAEHYWFSSDEDKEVEEHREADKNWEEVNEAPIDILLIDQLSSLISRIILN